MPDVYCLSCRHVVLLWIRFHQNIPTQSGSIWSPLEASISKIFVFTRVIVNLKWKPILDSNLRYRSVTNNLLIRNSMQTRPKSVWRVFVYDCKLISSSLCVCAFRPTLLHRLSFLTLFCYQTNYDWIANESFYSLQLLSFSCQWLESPHPMMVMSGAGFKGAWDRIHVRLSDVSVAFGELHPRHSKNSKHEPWSLFRDLWHEFLTPSFMSATR